MNRLPGQRGGRAHEIASNKRSCARYAGAGRVQTGPGRRRGYAGAGHGWLGDLLLGRRHPLRRLLPGGVAAPGPERAAREGQVDPGCVGGQLHRLLACAGRAQSAAGGKQHAYAPGSAEELNLRYNTHYIAPNAATVLAGVLSLLLGAMVTFVVVLAPLYALAHAWG